MNDGLLLLGVAALATGLVGGFISGLFGVGGGIVIVPVLDTVLGSLGVDATVRMQVAVATSLATIVPTSIASARAHHRRGSVDLVLARRWAPALVVGAAAGSWLATGALAGALPALFGTVAAIMAVKMLLPMEDKVLAPDIPTGPLVQAVPLTIGAVSSMMGIGGGTLSVPALTLMSQPVHRAVGTANLFGLAIALPGTVGIPACATRCAGPAGHARSGQSSRAAAHRTGGGARGTMGSASRTPTRPAAACCRVRCLSSPRRGEDDLPQPLLRRPPHPFSLPRATSCIDVASPRVTRPRCGGRSSTDG